jgi:hypothetical protein
MQHLTVGMSSMTIAESDEKHDEADDDEQKEESRPRTELMDFWVGGVQKKSNNREHFRKDFIIDSDAPVVTLPVRDTVTRKSCRGEPMRHQASAIWLLNELENADELKFVGDYCLSTVVKTNRYKLKMPMASGKTKTAIGLIIHSPRPKIKPIYYFNSSSDRWFLQERVFAENTIIWPTVVIARSSIYSQWQDQIAEFSTLRVLPVGDSKTLIAFVRMANENIAMLNANYDIILMDYKSISGKTDAITDKCAALFDINTKKQKHLVPLAINALSRRCFARVIYDDSEFHIKAAAFENAISCIYLSATHQYGTLRGASRLHLRDTDANTFENALEYPSYTFDSETFDGMITVSITPEFLKDSIDLGISTSTIPSDDSLTQIADAAKSLMYSSMMPSEPEVWICPIVNSESKVIDVIGCLCDDAKIMESVNSLTVTSFAEVIKTLMAGRYEIYKAAMRIVNHYSGLDMNALASLPKPPEGLSFTVDNLRRCEPIMFAWRDLPNRIAEVIASEQKVIDNERKVLERVKSHLEDTDCGICLESVKDDASGIMLCCNKILHIKCILRCSGRRCAFCRAPYGISSKETFVPMHHETDWTAFTEAKTLSLGMEAVLHQPTTDTVELTKLSVLRAIALGRFAEIKRERVRLKKLGTIIYDSTVEAKTEDRMERLKILIYSSADDTLKKIEADMPIHHAHLTASAAVTSKKIRAFRSSVVPSAILANSWRDAAGIDFKTATDVVIMNYVDADSVVQQMVGRLQRMGRTTRARIWLIAFNNECQSWQTTHCEAMSK